MDIDPKIRPLVEALNALEGVRTIASCEGHFRRISDPYVYFHCSPATAKTIAVRLNELNYQGRLFHWWTLIGCFNCEHELCFRLYAPALDHGRGTFRTFVNYIVFRERIDRDLFLLSVAWQESAEIGRKLPVQIHPVEGGGGDESYDRGEHPVPSLPPGNLPQGIGIAAVRTFFLDVRRKLLFAEEAIARSSRGHAVILPGFGTIWNLTRLVMLVTFLALTLGACADVELQKDGTGTDEMLRSPCACAPIPYDPAFYRWVG